MKLLNNFDYETILSINSKKSKNENKINIKLISNFNDSILSHYIQFYLKQKSFHTSFIKTEYDQITKEIINLKNVKKLNYLVLIQDISFFEDVSANNLFEYIKTFENNLFILTSIKNFNDFNVVINKMTLPSFVKTFSFKDQKKISIKIKKFNNLVDKLSIQNKNLKFFDLEKIFFEIGFLNSINKKLYFLFKSPYFENAMHKISNEISKLVNSFSNNRKKCLVVDLDNTLWGGVLGEDGIDNIDLNKTFDGQRYLDFQNYLINLSKKGVLLAICSKNNLTDVQECFKKNKDLKIKLNNFSSIKVNWLRKSKNILDISKELNIGLDSLVFIDDSKFEQEEVKKSLPDVEVLPVSNVSDFISCIEDSGFFYLDKETKEDQKKILQYKIIKKAQNLKFKVKSYNEYLKKLKMQLIISKVDANTFDRSLQLINKVNQFNLINNRFDNLRLSNFLKNKSNITLIARLKDKFGDHGLTALIMSRQISEKKYELVNYLMSCRILGRNVEKTFMNFFLNFLNKNNIHELEGKFVKSKKNIQCKNFYLENNFVKKKDKYIALLNKNKIKDNVKYIDIKYEKN